MKITGNKLSGIKVKLDTERRIRQELERQNEDYSDQMSVIEIKLDTERRLRQELKRQNEDYW